MESPSAGRESAGKEGPASIKGTGRRRGRRSYTLAELRRPAQKSHLHLKKKKRGYPHKSKAAEVEDVDNKPSSEKIVAI